MRLLSFAASLRQGSLNRKLITLAAAQARAQGAQVDLVEFGEFMMPLYDGDLEVSEGLPPGAHAFIRRLEPVDGMILSSPEYNYSVPGTLKNAIDWISRAKPMPLAGKSALLLSASPSAVGGVRGLWHLRVPLEGLNVHVYPEMFSLAVASEAFDAAGDLVDPQVAKRLERLVGAYLKVGEAIARAPG